VRSEPLIGAVAGAPVAGRPEPDLPAPPSLQQKDNLCGPFHVARVLREAGVTEWRGEVVDQDLVALRSGTLLPAHELGPQVPPGAPNLRDYRYELGRVEQARSGTSPRGLAGALEELSGGRLVAIPLSGQWNGAVVEALVEGGGDCGARLIANLRTGLLWASRPPIESLLAALDGGPVGEAPRADWDAGHFVELVQLVRGRRGALVLVQDSYPSLGWMGRHLQPPSALARALLRGDGRGGGALAVVAPDAAPAIEQLAGELALEIAMWEN
jgi:hypothetical protein